MQVQFRVFKLGVKDPIIDRPITIQEPDKATLFQLVLAAAQLFPTDFKPKIMELRVDGEQRSYPHLNQRISPLMRVLELREVESNGDKKPPPESPLPPDTFILD